MGQKFSIWQPKMLCAKHTFYLLKTPEKISLPCELLFITLTGHQKRFVVIEPLEKRLFCIGQL